MTEAEKLAQQFHEIYERLAPDFSYETRKASAKSWVDVPDNNKNLMIAVCDEILNNDFVSKEQQKKLKIALEALVWIKDMADSQLSSTISEVAQQAIKEIGEE